METTDIYKIVLAQLARHFLTAAATLLGAYGVSESMQGQLVDATVAIAVSAIVFLATQGWAYVTTHQAIFRLPPNTEWAIEDKSQDQNSGA
jgi:hypothetical protein